MSEQHVRVWGAGVDDRPTDDHILGVKHASNVFETSDLVQ